MYESMYQESMYQYYYSINRTYYLAKKLELLKNVRMSKYMSVPTLLRSRRILPDSAVGLFLKLNYSIRNKTIRHNNMITNMKKFMIESTPQLYKLYEMPMSN